MGDEYYFAQALSNFTRNFAYGDAICHLVDKGYTTEKIIKEFQYPLPKDTIDRMVQEHLMDRVAEHLKNNPSDYAYVKSLDDRRIELWMRVEELEYELNRQNHIRQLGSGTFCLKERKLHSLNGNDLVQLVLEGKESIKVNNEITHLFQEIFPQFHLQPGQEPEERNYL